MRRNSGSTTYLSPQIQYKFIQLFVSTVKKPPYDILTAKYNEITFDSTHGADSRRISARDHQIRKYKLRGKTVVIKKFFSEFIHVPVYKKDAASVADIKLQLLAVMGANLETHFKSIPNHDIL